MARLYIGLTPNGIRTLRNIRTDRTGEPLVFVDENETKSVTFDLTAYLDDGETISSVTTSNQSVTATIDLASPTFTVELSATTASIDGTAELTITLSSGEVMRQVIHARRMRRYDDETRQRDYV